MHKGVTLSSVPTVGIQVREGRVLVRWGRYPIREGKDIRTDL